MSSDDAQPAHGEYLPIAVGFYLLALPLCLAAVFVAEQRGIYAGSGLSLLALAVLVHWRCRR